MIWTYRMAEIAQSIMYLCFGLASIIAALAWRDDRRTPE